MWAIFWIMLFTLPEGGGEQKAEFFQDRPTFLTKQECGDFMHTNGRAFMQMYLAAAPVPQGTMLEATAECKPYGTPS